MVETAEAVTTNGRDVQIKFTEKRKERCTMKTQSMSVLLLVVLGVLVVLSALGQVFIEWEWWLFLLVLSSMAFVVGLGLFLARRIVR